MIASHSLRSLLDPLLAASRRFFGSRECLPPDAAGISRGPTEDLVLVWLVDEDAKTVEEIIAQERAELERLLAA